MPIFLRLALGLCLALVIGTCFGGCNQVYVEAPPPASAAPEPYDPFVPPTPPVEPPPYFGHDAPICDPAPEPTSAPVTNSNDLFEVSLQSQGGERKRPLVNGVDVFDFEMIAHVNSLGISTIDLSFDHDIRPVYASIAITGANGFFKSYLFLNSQVAGKLQQITPEDGQKVIFTLDQGDKATIYIGANVVDAGLSDNELFKSTLLGATTVRDQQPDLFKATALDETTTLQSLSDMTYQHTVTTVADVTSGNTAAIIAEGVVKNNSLTHASETMEAQCIRLTPGDATKLKLVCDGLFVADGVDYVSYNWDGTTTSWVSFRVPHGNMLVQPLGQAGWQIIADTSTSTTPSIELRFDMIIDLCDNGQSLGHGVFYDPQTGAPTVFRLNLVP